MSAADRAAFLRAIADHPDDDLPRLVYADWLDEHGDPARAEFIRVQCALARLPAGDTRAAALARREAELLTDHQADWLRPLAGLAGGAKFRRGFVEEVTVETAVFLDRGADLF